MSSSSHSSSTAADNPSGTQAETADMLDALVADIIRAEEAGEGIDRDALLADHPDYADDLRQFFADREQFQRLAMAEPPKLKPGTMIGLYKLLQQIGEGGFGAVYMAEQTAPVQRRVALKIIKPGMDSQQVIARFEAERQALAMMEHINVAKVLDAGESQSGRPYFVMELVRGVPITKYCDDNRLTIRERLELFMPVCHAIQHAHQKGVIHRDIKPSNVLVSLYDGRPVPKVIDFGIAKAVEQKLTQRTLFTEFGQVIGTLEYMSPEQAELNQLDVDTRSDVYSLGVLLYELLTGSTPFTREQLRSVGYEEMLRTIREVEPPTPSRRLTESGDALPTISSVRRTEPQKLSKSLRGDLDWIVMKCLEKDRTRRYETANGLSQDLRRHLENEPVIARPPSTAYRLQKVWRRNRLAFSAAAVVAAALVLATGVSLWQAARATHASMMATRAQANEREHRRAAEGAQRVAEEASKRSAQERYRADAERERADAQARKALQNEQQSRRLLYASDLSLAQQALRLNNLGRARRLLDRHRPQPDEEDLRSWEWRYLWQLTRSNALARLVNRPVRGFSVSFSPDGTRLAAGWIDGRVELWDVPGRRFIRALTERASLEGSWPLGRVAFSPVRNLLAATSGRETVRLYDLDSDRESVVWQSPNEGTWRVRDLDFSGDGSTLVIYAGSSSDEFGDAVWVVDVASGRVERRHPTAWSRDGHFGAARLSPDGQRLYVARSDASSDRYNIQCIDVGSGNELWQSERERDTGLSALAVSPDGEVIASASGFEDPTIRIWDSAAGRLLVRLDGHTAWVCRLAFSKDGRRLISAATDQSIRVWDTSTWTERAVLRGHTDEVHDVAIGERAGLLASAGKDGNLMLWKADGRSAADCYLTLLENLTAEQLLPMDRSRVLMLPANKPPELLDLRRDAPPIIRAELGSSSNFLCRAGANAVCLWDPTGRIVIRELRASRFIERGAVRLGSGKRPAAAAYSVARRLLAWTCPASSPTSVFLARLEDPGRRIEWKSGVTGVHWLDFSEDGDYLTAANGDGIYSGGYQRLGESMRVWNVESGELVASIDDEVVSDAVVISSSHVLAALFYRELNHELRFYDLAHPGRAPRVVSGKHHSTLMAVSRNAGLLATSTHGGAVRLFDPRSGELLKSLHGHLNGAYGLAFSSDGRRLISGSGGREAVKLWDVRTGQELLTLAGTGGLLPVARWSSNEDVILAGPPWQAWRAPSWEEIAAAEAALKQPMRFP